MNPPPQPPAINFLPDWYARRQSVQRRRQRVVALGGVMAIVMAWSWVGMRVTAGQVDAHLTRLEQRALAADAQAQRLAALEADREALAEEVDRHRRVARAIDIHHVNAAVGDLTPPAIFLHGLSIDDVARKRDVVGPDGEVRQEVDRSLRVEIEGAAPTNVEIANYVGRLSATPLFENVKMIHARQGEIGEASTRRFRITMEVPLDRRYRVRGQGGAHDEG